MPKQCFVFAAVKICDTNINLKLLHFSVVARIFSYKGGRKLLVRWCDGTSPVCSETLRTQKLMSMGCLFPVLTRPLNDMSPHVTKGHILQGTC